MSRKNESKNLPKTTNAPSLAQLLGGDDDSEQFNFDGLDWLAFGAFVATATALGALVSAYVSNSDGCFVVAIRFGDDRKAFQFTNAEQATNNIKALTKKLAAYSKGRSGLG